MLQKRSDMSQITRFGYFRHFRVLDLVKWLKGQLKLPLNCFWGSSRQSGIKSGIKGKTNKTNDPSAGNY